MELTIYIDVLWLRTFFVELQVCLFLNLWMKRECPVIHILWVNAVAAALQIGIFVLAGYGVIVMAGGIMLRAVVICFLFHPQTAGVFLRLFSWGMVATVAIGGILGIVQAYLPESCWFALGCVICACSMLVSLVLEERRMLHDERLCRVTLHQGASAVEVVGLYDTGNRLNDPYVHAPVYILAEAEYTRLIGESTAVRLIPYLTIGVSGRLMEVTTIDALEWNGGRQMEVVIGRADDAVFAGKDYRMILPAAFDFRLKGDNGCT